MEKFKKLFNINYPKIIGAFFVVAFAFSYFTVGASGNPYSPGATLDPSCGPSDSNCYVSKNNPVILAKVAPTMYSPGATLDPSCGPSDLYCYVAKNISQIPTSLAVESSLKVSSSGSKNSNSANIADKKENIRSMILSLFKDPSVTSIISENVKNEIAKNNIAMRLGQTVASIEPSSPAPIPAVFIPTGIVQPNPVTNFSGATLFGATDLSSKNFNSNNATISSSLTVTGSSTFSGDANFTGSLTGVATNLTGTATGLTSGITNALKSATTNVDVSASTAPTAGQVLTAVDSTHATWQSSSSSSPLTTKGDIYTYSTTNARLPVGADGLVLAADSTQATGLNWISVGTGSVTSVSVVTANGISGSVANASTTPALTLTLGAITPTTVNGNTITTGTGTLTLGAGKTLTASNTLTFTGTDSSSVAFGSGGTVLYNGGALGTPSSATLTNATGLPISTGVSGLGTGVATFLATPSSSNLISAVTDETGTGALVFGTSPTLTTPTLGVASATTINKLTITAPATGSTLTVADGKTLTASNTLTFTGTDSSSVAFGSGGTVLYNGGALGTPSSATLTNATGLPISTGVSGLGTGVATFLGTPSSANLATAITDETGSGALVFATSPTLVTPNIGVATGTNLALTSTNTTEATTSSALVLNANSLTTGTGFYAASSTLTSGYLANLQVSGTAAAASQTALNILTAGATSTNAITTYGAQISNTHTNATSGTNVALYLNASGATTANYGLIVNSGRVIITGTTYNSINGGVSQGININGSASNSPAELALTPGSGVEGYIGTTNGTALNLVTNGGSKIAITSSGSVGVGTQAPSYLLSLSGTSTRTFGMNRNSTAATAGQGFIITAGGAIAGTADLAGGDLSLKSGISTGTGSSAIRLYTTPAAGSTSTSDNTQTERLSILGSGFVGIGATTPATLLELGSSDLGNGAAGPILTLGRNTNATNTGAGSINFQQKGGTAGYVWQDAAGNMRIHTSAPTNANDTAGTVIGTQTSTRETKQDITDYTDYNSALSMVLNAPLHTFRYIKEVQGYGENSPLAKIRIGYIADEVNPAFMIGNAIDQVSVNGILLASIKALDLKIKNLENKNANTIVNSSEINNIVNNFLSTTLDKIENGVSYMKNIVVSTLKIGNKEKRTGITLYDEITGEPYCISIANGAQKTSSGECKIIESTQTTVENTPPSETPPTPPENIENPSPTPTPEPSPTSTPESAPSPQPEI